MPGIRPLLGLRPADGLTIGQSQSSRPANYTDFLAASRTIVTLSKITYYRIFLL
jgi:hypothetical protein